VNKVVKFIYDVHRLSRVTLGELINYSWTLSDVLDPNSKMYVLAKRVANAIAKRAAKAIASPNARMATRILTEGINASMKLIGNTRAPSAV
jgi:hypothetical protein